jgi:hypothetical protein
VNDDERQYLLTRLEKAERACRRWRVLALVTIPVLVGLLVLALGNAITASLTLREHVMRERRAVEDARRAAEAALRQFQADSPQSAEPARDRPDEALRGRSKPQWSTSGS